MLPRRFRSSALARLGCGSACHRTGPAPPSCRSGRTMTAPRAPRSTRGHPQTTVTGSDPAPRSAEAPPRSTRRRAPHHRTPAPPLHRDETRSTDHHSPTTLTASACHPVARSPGIQLHPAETGPRHPPRRTQPQRHGEQPPPQLAPAGPASEPSQPSLTVTTTTDRDSQRDRGPPASPPHRDQIHVLQRGAAKTVGEFTDEVVTGGGNKLTNYRINNKFSDRAGEAGKLPAEPTVHVFHSWDV